LDDGATVKDALTQLITEYGEDFKKKTGITLKNAFETVFNVFLNGTHIHLPSTFDHELEDGDELVLLRPVRGG
jgi:molybdopterin converting factor small subunit